MILEKIGVFILPPERCAEWTQKPLLVPLREIIGNAPGSPAFPAIDLRDPAFLHVGEEIDAVFFLVGEDDVERVRPVEVDETALPPTATQTEV